jgi:hypothetical protein
MTLVDVFPVCPPGRMGIACNYYCELGFQSTAQIDGRGGFIPPLYLGLRTDDMYLFYFIYYVVIYFICFFFFYDKKKI